MVENSHPWLWMAETLLSVIMGRAAAVDVLIDVDVAVAAVVRFIRRFTMFPPYSAKVNRIAPSWYAWRTWALSNAETPK